MSDYRRCTHDLNGGRADAGTTLPWNVGEDHDRFVRAEGVENWLPENGWNCSRGAML